MYFDDFGAYPQAASCAYESNCYAYSFGATWDVLATALAPYISPLPKDPINSSCQPWVDNCFSYTYGNVSRTRPQYDLTMQFENDRNSLRCEIKGWRFYFDNQGWCPKSGGSYVNSIYEASQ